MITTLIPTELWLPEDKSVRSRGIHQSKIVRAIAAETGILDAKWVEDLSLVDRSSAGWWSNLDEASRLRIAIGIAWEEWYIPLLPNVVKHPGEMCIEGVYMTHDGESLDTLVRLADGRHEYELALHEVKTTYKSIKTVAPKLIDDTSDTPDLSSQWMWLAQTKAYCKGLGALVAYLHVLFICGDYKFPISPQLKLWRIDYTQDEIQENWELMMDYVRHRRQIAAEGGEPL